jgi:hypothetical protein
MREPRLTDDRSQVIWLVLLILGIFVSLAGWIEWTL